MLWTRRPTPAFLSMLPNNLTPDEFLEESQKAFEELQKEDFDELNMCLVLLANAIDQVRPPVPRGIHNYLDRCLAKTIFAASRAQRDF